MSAKNITNYQLLFLLYPITLLILAFTTPGTGDEGDSIMHYLYARYAFAHPQNFFNHWAKPIYVLLAAPFAQAGFIGVKLMNTLLSTASAYLAYGVARRLKMPRAGAAFVFTAAAPMGIYLTLSGLTEPLFAFWLIASVYLAVRGQGLAAVIWVSFLPFVRSEGLVILCVWAVYLLFTRRWRWLPLLMAGHVALSIAGYFYYGNLLWVFKKIPYATMGSVYGAGKLLHFVKGLWEVVGYPMYLLLGLGMLYGAYALGQIIKQKKYHPISAQELWLVYGSFTAYVVAHTLFWYLGIFQSFGLLRVLVGVIPLSGLICLRGLNGAVNVLPHKTAQTAAVSLVLLAVLAYPFYSLNYAMHFDLKADQKAQNELANFVKQQYGAGYKYYFDMPHLSLALHTDPFDDQQKQMTAALFTGAPLPDKTLVIWDDWYSPVEAGTKLEKLVQDDRLEPVRFFEAKDPWGSPRLTHLFVKKRYANTTSNDGTTLQPIFITDFETPDIANTYTTQAYAGKYAGVAHAGSPFSAGMDLPASELPTNALIRAEAYFYLSQKEPDRFKEPLFIISFENDSSYSWNKLPLQAYLPENKWQKLSFTAQVPPLQTPADRVKVYVYNLSQTCHAYIDSLSVNVVSGIK